MFRGFEKFCNQTKTADHGQSGDDARCARMPSSEFNAVLLNVHAVLAPSYCNAQQIWLSVR